MQDAILGAAELLFSIKGFDGIMEPRPVGTGPDEAGRLDLRLEAHPSSD
jgi:hypothetical protein